MRSLDDIVDTLYALGSDLAQHGRNDLARRIEDVADELDAELEADDQT